MDNVQGDQSLKNATILEPRKDAPSTNRGCLRSFNAGFSVLSTGRVSQHDWYQASINRTYIDVISRVMREIHVRGIGTIDLEDCPPINNYLHSTQLTVDGIPALQFYWDRVGTRSHDELIELSRRDDNHRSILVGDQEIHFHDVDHTYLEELGETHVKTTGNQSELMTQIIRVVAPDHKVSRSDSCIDFIQDWHVVESVIDGVLADNPNIHAQDYGDRRRKKGRTIYLGTPTATWRVCIYQKGLQLHYEKGVKDYDPNHVRIELRARPETRRKTLFSQYDSDQQISVCKKYCSTIKEFAPIAEKRVESSIVRLDTNLEKALRQLEKQYSKTLLEASRIYGTDQVIKRLGL